MVIYMGRAVRKPALLTSRDDVGKTRLKFDVIIAHVMIKTSSVSGVFEAFRKVLKYFEMDIDLEVSSKIIQY